MSGATMMKSTEFVAPMLQIKVALQRPRGMELHRMRGAHSLATLQAAVAEMWPLKHQKKEGRVEHVLEYEDDEGDKVRLTSDAEWMEAVRLLGDSPGQAVLKLFVRRKAFTTDGDGAEDSGVTDGGAASGVTDGGAAEESPQFRCRGHGHGHGHRRGWAMRALLKSAAGLEEASTSESGDGAGAVKEARKRCGGGWRFWKEERKTDPADLACMSPEEKKNVLGERIWQLPIINQHPERKGKVLGMLMAMDSSEMQKALESPQQLRTKVRELVMKLRTAGRCGAGCKDGVEQQPQQSQGEAEQVESEIPEAPPAVLVAEPKAEVAEAKSVAEAAGEAGEAVPEVKADEASSMVDDGDEKKQQREPMPAAPSKLPEDVQTMLSIFPYLTGTEAVIALRRARGNLGQAINGVLARAERQGQHL